MLNEHATLTVTAVCVNKNSHKARVGICSALRKQAGRANILGKIPVWKRIKKLIIIREIYD